MPARVRKSRRKAGGYDIVGPNGKVEGWSKTRAKAESSVRIRNRASK